MSAPHQTDRLLWDAVLAGDGDSFGALFERHRDRVFRHAWRLVDDATDAEDLTAIVFLELWRRRTAARMVDDSLLPWLLVTTNNTARNARRSRRRHARLLARLPPPEQAPDFSEAADTRLDGEPATTALSHAIASLPRIDRDLLTLTALEGFTLHQASDALGLTYGAAKTRMSRARRKLSTAVSASLTGPPAPPTAQGAPS